MSETEIRATYVKRVLGTQEVFDRILGGPVGRKELRNNGLFLQGLTI